VKDEKDGPKYTMGKVIKPKKKDYNKGIFYFIELEFDYVAESTVGFIPKYLANEVRKE